MAASGSDERLFSALDALRVAAREEARALSAGVDVDLDVDDGVRRVARRRDALEQPRKLGRPALREDLEREGLAPRRRGARTSGVGRHDRRREREHG